MVINFVLKGMLDLGPHSAFPLIVIDASSSNLKGCSSPCLPSFKVADQYLREGNSKESQKNMK
jgi:hypothetical protein